MKVKLDHLFIILVFIDIIFRESVYSMLRPYHFIGTVIEKDSQNAAITIQTDYTFAADPGETYIGTWNEYRSILDGLAPNYQAINELIIGDTLVATSHGVPGENWITLSKLKLCPNKSPYIEAYKEILPFIQRYHYFVTDSYGDPAELKLILKGHKPEIKLLGQYTISYKNTADCSNCRGKTCTVKYTITTVTGGIKEPNIFELKPDESCTYRDEYYSIEITFLFGETYSFPECEEYTGWVGPQKNSNFIIHIFKNNNKTD